MRNTLNFPSSFALIASCLVATAGYINLAKVMFWFSVFSYAVVILVIRYRWWTYSEELGETLEEGPVPPRLEQLQLALEVICIGLFFFGFTLRLRVGQAVEFSPELFGF